MTRRVLCITFISLGQTRSTRMRSPRWRMMRRICLRRLRFLMLHNMLPLRHFGPRRHPLHRPQVQCDHYQALTRRTGNLRVSHFHELPRSITVLNGVLLAHVRLLSPTAKTLLVHLLNHHATPAYDPSETFLKEACPHQKTRTLMLLPP